MITLTFDGGCRGNGTENAVMYGSFCVSNRAGQRIITETFGPGTNNQAEYISLIEGLKYTLTKLTERKVEPGELIIRTDSQLVIGQLSQGWKCNDYTLRLLRAEATELVSRFQTVKWQKVPRQEIVDLLGH